MKLIKEKILKSTICSSSTLKACSFFILTNIGQILYTST